MLLLLHLSCVALADAAAADVFGMCFVAAADSAAAAAADLPRFAADVC